MKKLVSGFFLAGLMGISLMAAPWGNGWVDGKISRIQKGSSGDIVIYMSPDGSSTGETQNYLNRTLTGDDRKEYFAIMLTAKAGNADISLYGVSGDWKYFKLK